MLLKPESNRNLAIYKYGTQNFHYFYHSIRSIITYMNNMSRAALYFLNKTENVFIAKSIANRQNCNAKIEQ